MDYETFKKIIRNEAPIYIDTNCLLELYKSPVKLVSTFIDGVYDKEIIDLFKISPTVKKEFDRNIKNVRKESGKKYNDNLGEIERSLNKINSKIMHHVSNSYRCNDPSQSVTPEELKEKVNSLILDIKEVHPIDETKVIDQVTDKKINDFVNNLFKASNMIKEPEYKELISLICEGYTRVKHNIPPGFIDKEKYHEKKKSVAKNGNKILNPDELIDYLGDYFIWKDILSDSIDDDKIKWKLFVTGDLKEDWFNVPSDKKLENYYPREELIKEFKCYHDPSIELEFLPFDLFVQYMIQYAGKIDFESIFSASVVPYIEDDIRDLVCTEIRSIVETELIDDGNLNQGFRVDDYEVDTDLDSINFEDFSILNSEEIKQESNIYHIKFYVETEFLLRGDFSLCLEIVEDFKDRVQGEFYVNSGTLVYSIQVCFKIETNDTSSDDEKDNVIMLSMVENEPIEKIITMDDHNGLDFENIFINPGGFEYEEYPTEEEMYEDQQ